MIEFGELRSAVENCRYEELPGVFSVIPSQYNDWLFAKMPWMRPHTFGLLRDALVDVNQGNFKRIASVVYLILAGGHREHWMRYAMVQLSSIDHESTNASDLVWWMCSHAVDLHERILDAGHTCDEDLVWEFLAQFAYWELVRSNDYHGIYESPGCGIYEETCAAYVVAAWPSDEVCDGEDICQRTWGVFVSTEQMRAYSTTEYCSSEWTVATDAIIKTTRKAMKGNA